MLLFCIVNLFVIELYVGISFFFFEFELFRECMLNMENYRDCSEIKVFCYFVNKVLNVFFF